MPWIETNPMNEKIKFLSAYLNAEESSFTALCDRFKISCKTGYKYINRYKAEGIDGLKARSRAPLHNANKIHSLMEENILRVKSKYPNWGSKKILHWLKQEEKEVAWPARSTIDDLLKRHNLVRPRKRKRHVSPYTEPFILCEKPNDIWSIDYKGQFALGNNELCYPLTITDNFSRYLLAIKGSNQISMKMTKKVLHRLFSEYGLPLAIRSDNGVPFAGTGLGGLSQISVWLIKLGIIPERIRKGHPEENGRHERMHFTLKQDTTNPPQFNHKLQQQSFNSFRKIFNNERPHEGINFERPAWLYKASLRPYPKKLEPIEYDQSALMQRSIRTNGTMKWKGKELFISETLSGERIAFKPYSEDEWIIYFSFMPIGLFNERLIKINKI